MADAMPKACRRLCIWTLYIWLARWCARALAARIQRPNNAKLHLFRFIVASAVKNKDHLDSPKITPQSIRQGGR